MEDREHNDILEYWFAKDASKTLWFQSNGKLRDSIDKEITLNFGNYLLLLETASIAEINKLPICEIISSIIILDQFSRHIYRDTSLSENALSENALSENALSEKSLSEKSLSENALSEKSLSEKSLSENALHVEKIKRNTKKATILALSLLRGLNHSFELVVTKFVRILEKGMEQGKQKLEISGDVLAFMLMPLKHHNLEQYWHLIKDTLVKYDYLSHPTLFRFYKDSIKKVTLLHNNGAVENAIASYILEGGDGRYRGDPHLITDFLPEKFFTIDKVFWNSVDNYKVWAKHPLSKTIVKFLLDFLSECSVENPTLSVSLSGGVDSMVMTFIFALLSRCSTEAKLPPFTLQATHINYKNRDVSDQEANLVVWFCTQIKVPIFVRTLHEIQRRDNNRDFYEKMTRVVRFDLYDKLPRPERQSNSFVILGKSF
jgi:hypothetical protein